MRTSVFVAAGLPARADRHHELAVLGEFENLVIVWKIRRIVALAVRVADDPHEANDGGEQRVQVDRAEPECREEYGELLGRVGMNAIRAL